MRIIFAEHFAVNTHFGHSYHPTCFARYSRSPILQSLHPERHEVFAGLAATPRGVSRLLALALEVDVQAVEANLPGVLIQSGFVLEMDLQQRRKRGAIKRHEAF